jgi:hypothetical protein
MTSFVLQGGRCSEVVLQTRAKPGYSILDTLYRAHQRPLRFPDVQQPPRRALPSSPRWLNRRLHRQVLPAPHPLRRTLRTPANRDLHRRPRPLKTDVELDAPKTLKEAATLARAYIRRSTMALAPPAPPSHRSSGRAIVAPTATPPLSQRPAALATIGGASQGMPSSGPRHDQTFSRVDGAAPRRRPMLQVPIKVVTGSPEDLSHEGHLPPRRW